MATELDFEDPFAAPAPKGTPKTALDFDDPFAKPSAAPKSSGGIADFASGVGGEFKRQGLRALGGIALAPVGVAHLLGINTPERDEAIFGKVKALRDSADAIEAPTSTAGKAGAIVGGFGAGLATLGAGEAGARGADVIDEGGTVGQAQLAAGISGGAAVAGLGIPGLGKTIGQRVVRQGVASGLIGEGARVAENAVLPDSMHQDFDPVSTALNVGVGAAGGLMPHGAPAESAAKPLALGHEPDFVADAQGRTVVNKGDRSLGQPADGPGMDQQAPGGPPSPVIPPEPAPLALTHQPDITVDAQGRAIANHGVKSGQPVGGAFEDQAPPPKPAGPISAALEVGGVKPTPETPAAETAPRAKTEAKPEATAKKSLVDQYADRQQQIDGLNTQRRAGTLEVDGLNQLHDLRDVQDGHDPLTGLLNQKGYDDALKSGQYTHAAALDLDRFKPINDTFGHGAGDAVLQHVAQTLHDASEGKVTVARIHGDEYAGLASTDPTEAMTAAQKQLRETPFTIKYEDADGNPASHTFENGIGITFGVGHDYESADANAIRNKPAGSRRDENNNQGVVRSGDIQAAEGRAGDVAARGGQEDLPGLSGAADGIGAGEEGVKPAGDEPAPQDHNFVKTPPNDSVAMSRGDNPPKGMDKSALADTLKPTIDKFQSDAPRVQINQSHDEAPGFMRNAQGFDQSVEGAYDAQTGTVHLFADAIKTPERAAQVLAHEVVGHYGVEHVVGGDWDKLVNDIGAQRAKPSASLRDLFAEVEKRYPGADNATFASEAMAVMAERGVRNTFTDRVIAGVRKFLRSIGIQSKFSDAELRQMVVAASRHATTETRGAAVFNPRVAFSRSDEAAPSVAYAGDRFVQRDRLAERKFDKPYTKLSADEKSDVDALFRTTSAAKNPMFSKQATERSKQSAAAEVKRAVVEAPRNVLAKAAQAIKRMYVLDAAGIGREVARGDIRAAWARMDEAIGHADTAVKKTMDYYDRRSPDVLKNPRKALADVIAFQKGEPIPDKNVKPFFDAISDMLTKQAKEIQSFGKGHLDSLVENYFPQMWKDPVRAEQFEASQNARRPLSGDKKFTKQRTFQNFEEGIRAGMEPISHNPVDMMMSRYQSGEKLLASLRVMKAMEDRGTVKSIEQGERVPLGWARVNDPSFNGKIVPELIARDLNNHLDPGLTRFAAWRSFRYLQNMMLSARLGLSAFHAGMTTLDTLTSHADVAWRSALNGDIKGALHQLVKTFTSPITSPMEGGKLLRQFEGKDPLDPKKPQDVQTAAIFKALTEGGMRARMSPTDYNADLTKFVRAYRQGDTKAAVLKAVPALIEFTTHHIATKLVPSQKMTARVLLAKFELDKIADKLGTEKGDYAATVEAMHPDALRQVMRKINSDVDDRLGQFAYANEFWNKTLKDALHASVQSVGWNFGSARLFIGSAKDIGRLAAPEKFVAPLDKAGKITDATMSRLTNRLGYMITLNAIVAASGSLLQYAMTGQGPQSIKDMAFPRTGRKNADDSDERLALPTYVKDEFSLSKHPLTTIQHKLHPMLSMLAELASNKDFYGTQIYDPNASVPAEAKQVLEYFVRGFEPYAVSGAVKNAQAGSNPVMQALPFIGVTPAPGDISRSKFQDYVAEKYFDSLPQGARTQAQAEQSAKFHQAVADQRAGKKPDTTGLTPSQIKSIRNAAQTVAPQFRFGKLPLVQKVEAYEMATPQERDEYKLKQALSRAKSSINKLPPEQRQEMKDKINAALSGQ
jgi:diguanylate cyclase (GGDEF)-like protein